MAELTEHMKKRIWKMLYREGYEPDTIDVFAEWDSSLTAQENYNLFEKKAKFYSGTVNYDDLEAYKHQLEQHKEYLAEQKQTKEHIPLEEEATADEKFYAEQKAKQETYKKQDKQEAEQANIPTSEDWEKSNREMEQLKEDQRKYEEMQRQKEKESKVYTRKNEKTGKTEAVILPAKPREELYDLPKPYTEPTEDTEQMYNALEKKRLKADYAEKAKKAKELGLPPPSKWKSKERLDIEHEAEEREALSGDTAQIYGKRHKALIFTKHINGEEKISPQELKEIKKTKIKEEVAHEYEKSKAAEYYKQQQEKLEQKAKYGKLYYPAAAYGFVTGQKYKSGSSLKDLLQSMASRIKSTGRR